MSNYVLSCCSTADLSAEHFRSRDISYICFRFRLNGVDYPDDLGQSVPFPDFYQAMRDGADTATSQVNVSDYEAYFSKFAAEGKDVLHVSLSSGLSGSVNSARTAAALVTENYPERKIYVVDSLGASSGYGLLMDTLADQRDKGLSLEELRDFAEAEKLHLHHIFFSTDLTFYVKGGRVSKAAGFFGGALNICPLLDMDTAGHLTVRKKAVGKRRVIQELLARTAHYIRDGADYDGKFYLCHSDCIDDANEVAAQLAKRYPKHSGEIEINNIGTTIGSHTGPGTVAVFFWGSDRDPA